MIKGFGDADFMVDPLQGVPVARSSDGRGFFPQGLDDF
jgi:hypothetical protein